MKYMYSFEEKNLKVLEKLDVCVESTTLVT